MNTKKSPNVTVRCPTTLLQTRQNNNNTNITKTYSGLRHNNEHEIETIASFYSLSHIRTGTLDTLLFLPRFLVCRCQDPGANLCLDVLIFEAYAAKDSGVLPFSERYFATRPLLQPHHEKAILLDHLELTLKIH